MILLKFLPVKKAYKPAMKNLSAVLFMFSLFAAGNTDLLFEPILLDAEAVFHLQKSELSGLRELMSSALVFKSESDARLCAAVIFTARSNNRSWTNSVIMGETALAVWQKMKKFPVSMHQLLPVFCSLTAAFPLPQKAAAPTENIIPGSFQNLETGQTSLPEPENKPEFAAVTNREIPTETNSTREADLLPEPLLSGPELTAYYEKALKKKILPLIYSELDGNSRMLFQEQFLSYAYDYEKKQRNFSDNGRKIKKTIRTLQNQK